MIRSRNQPFMPSDSSPLTWSDTIRSYADKRLFWVFILGCSSGFPWVLIGSGMSGWLKDIGMTLTAIGYFGSVTAVYAINFLWAPLIDRVKLPMLHSRFGQRRSWILLCQCLIVLCTLLLSGVNPHEQILVTSLVALGIAIASSTQDIAIDAFRIDTFPKQKNNKLPQASAMATIGWWTGYSLPGYVAFANADRIGWNQVYLLLALIAAALMIGTLLVKEPITQRDQLQAQAEQARRANTQSRLLVWLSVTVIEPFADFFRRNGTQVAVTILLFVFLFKVGEAFLGRMSIAFYRDIGFSNEQIGEYSKLIGWGATMLFSLLGSMVNVRLGIVKGLLIGGSAMAASNLMFAWIAEVGPNEHLLLATVLVDNFTTAFSTVAFVSFLTLLTGQAFSATQYALLASLGNFSRTTLASFSGGLADYLNNWSLFFIFTAIMVIPSLLMLYSLRHYFTALLQATRQDKEDKEDKEPKT